MCVGHVIGGVVRVYLCVDVEREMSGGSAVVGERFETGGEAGRQIA